MAPAPVPARGTPRWILSGIALAAAGLVLVLAMSTGNRLQADQPPDASPASPSAAGRTTTEAPDVSAVEVADGFLYAFGTLQAEKAIGYLADDAEIASLMTFIGADDVKGTEYEFRALFALLSAQGYRHTAGDCVQVSEEMSDGAATFRCPFRYYGLRSGEMGLPPFGGDSHFVVVVRDGLVVDASWSWDLTEFGPRLWDPFAGWLSAEHPKDVAFMYDADGGARLNRDSALLWEVRTREYVRAVADAGTIAGITSG